MARTTYINAPTLVIYTEAHRAYCVYDEASGWTYDSKIAKYWEYLEKLAENDGIWIEYKKGHAEKTYYNIGRDIRVDSWLAMQPDFWVWEQPGFFAVG
jgi:hypothetical protein